MLQSPLSNLRSLDELLDLPYFDFLGCLGFYSIHPGGLQKTQSLITSMNLPPTSAILEIGSGSGYTSTALLKAGVDLTICDPSERLMAAAIRNCKIFAGKTPKYFNCKAENIPPTKSYDGILLEAVYGFIEDKKAFHQVLPKIIEPKGKIGIIDFYYKKKPPQKLVDNLERVFGISFDVLIEEDWHEHFNKYNFVSWKEFDTSETKPATGNSVRKLLEANFLDTNILLQDAGTYDKIATRLNEYLHIFNWNKEYLNCFSAVLTARI